MMSWVVEELKGIDLGDRRRDKRAMALLDTLSSRPTASIPGACSGWSENHRLFMRTFHDGRHFILRSRVQPGFCAATPAEVPSLFSMQHKEQEYDIKK